MSDSEIKLVFVAGPYNGAGVYERECNIRNAEAVARKIWQLGHVGICVHSMNRYFFGSFPEEHAYAGDMVLLKRCDAVVFTLEWKNSKGSKREHAVATELGLPIFYEKHLGDLEVWLCGERE